MQNQNIIVTGGAGFIGSNFLNMMVARNPEITFINLDNLTYSSNLKNILVSNYENYKFFKGDICKKEFLEEVFKKFQPKGVIHFAAETHVDFSIKNPEIFVLTNVVGTQNLLEMSLKFKVERFHHISTDEVYGELDFEESPFTENHNLSPNSPYSASKASSDLLVRAYHKTFKLDTVITRCSNNYGPRQDLTKLIPKFITNLNSGKKVPLYKDGKNVRDWIYVDDHNRGVWSVFNNGRSGEVYNLGGGNEKSNLEITNLLLKMLNRDSSYIEFVADRPGHDLRYAIDYTKATTELGWKPQISFEAGLQKTVEFYTNN